MDKELSDIIEHFNLIDIQHQHSAFDSWLKSKLIASKSKDKESDVDRSRSIKAYNDWLHSKRLLELNSAKLKKQESTLKAMKEREERELLLKKQELSLVKFKEWKKSKKEVTESQQSKNIQKQAEILAEQEKRKSIAKEAVKKWNRQIKTRSQPHTYPHRNAWVDIVDSTPPTFSKSQTDPRNVKSLKSNKRSSQEQIYSPPALYKEYDLYSEKAPLFLLKYRNHVASGK